MSVTLVFFSVYGHIFLCKISGSSVFLNNIYITRCALGVSHCICIYQICRKNDSKYKHRKLNLKTQKMKNESSNFFNSNTFLTKKETNKYIKHLHQTNANKILGNLILVLSIIYYILKE